MARDKVIALTATSERPASTLSGYPMLVVALLAIAIDIYGIVQVANSDSRTWAGMWSSGKATTYISAGPKVVIAPPCFASMVIRSSGTQARALALSWSNSVWLMVPASSNAFADAIWSAGADWAATDWMYWSVAFWAVCTAAM